MADRKNFSRYNMRCGMVLRSDTADVSLDGFELPSLDNRFLVLKAEEIPGENAMYIMGTKIPLLADGYISYVGQPLLVLFGPDYESTELALEKIKVLTSPAKDDTVRAEAVAPDPLFFSWGLDNEDETEKEKQSLRKVESNLNIIPEDIKSYVRYDILSWVENNGSVHTQCPTQWADLVKETVAGATGKSPESIVVHSERYLSRYDEFLLTPALFAAYTAIAVEKFRLPCEMRPESWSKLTSFDFCLTTWLDGENRPKHEEITITVDQGAFAVNGKEVQRQLMAALIPKYNLDSFKVLIRTVLSDRRPTLFAGSAVYSAAVSAVAMHSSRLASRTLTTPLRFALLTNRETTKFTDWAPKHDITDLNERMKSVAEVSDYERKWSAASLHSGVFGLQGYLYGIGLSSGLSVSGFSTSFAKENQFQGQISYTQKKNIAVSGSIPSSISQDKTLKDLISQYFIKSDAGDSILFLENYPKAPDSGPDVLSSYHTIFLTQLMKAASKLASLMENGPVDLKFNSQNLALPCEFEYSGYGAAVCEITVPKVSLLPVAKKLWIDMALALPYSKGAQQKIKTIATETLSTLGAVISDNFSIGINLSSEKKETTVYSSLENTTRFLVTSAYITALWQALGEKSTVSVPLDAVRLEKYIAGGKDK